MAHPLASPSAVIVTDHRRSNSPPAVAVQVHVDDRLLLTVKEAARRLGISRSLLYELLAAGEIASIHVGRLRRVPATALTDFVIKQQAVGADGSDSDQQG